MSYLNLNIHKNRLHMCSLFKWNICNSTEIIKKEEMPIIPVEEKQFYEDVRVILLQARELAYKNASNIMTQAYWNVGKRIDEQELLGKERAKYGSYLIKKLSKELSDELGTGFSVASLKN